MDENPMNILQNIWEEETVKAYLDGSGSILCSHLFFRELPEMVWYSKVTKGEHPRRKYSRRHASRSIHPLYTDRRIQQRKLSSLIKATLVLRQ